VFLTESLNASGGHALIRLMRFTWARALCSERGPERGNRTVPEREPERGNWTVPERTRETNGEKTGEWRGPERTRERTREDRREDRRVVPESSTGVYLSSVEPPGCRKV